MPFPVLLALLLPALLSFIPDALARPRARAPWRRPWAALLAHLAGVAGVAALLLAVTARPGLSGFLALALVGFMAVVGNAKHQALREPLVFTDLNLFSQVFRYPRLYLPFLGWRGAAGLALGAAALAAAVALEPPLAAPVALRAGLLLFALLCAALLAGLAPRMARAPDLENDHIRLGFFATFCFYLFNGLRPKNRNDFYSALHTGPFGTSQNALPVHSQTSNDRINAPHVMPPHVICIQSESFFDARRLGPAIHTEVLREYDQALAGSVQHGQLRVPAWGANTMRTEFGFLSGLPESRMGYARYYPYAFLRRAASSMAAFFKRAGYRTLALHPFYKAFFGRDRAFALMGFDEFLDIDFFSQAEKSGPWVGDCALADDIILQLEEHRNADTPPLFLMAITMENHGPLYLESVAPGEAARYHDLGEAPVFRDLTAYLRHLAHADAMIGKLTKYLGAYPRPVVLCFYGDHVPSLPEVFDNLGVSFGESNYFIWKNRGPGRAERCDVPVAELGTRLLAVVAER